MLADGPNVCRTTARVSISRMNGLPWCSPGASPANGAKDEVHRTGVSANPEPPERHDSEKPEPVEMPRLQILRPRRDRRASRHEPSSAEARRRCGRQRRWQRCQTFAPQTAAPGHPQFETRRPGELDVSDNKVAPVTATMTSICHGGHALPLTEGKENRTCAKTANCQRRRRWS